MKNVPSYSKILTLGSAYTENALKGQIVIQEKVDGSMFAFGWNESGELVARSKGMQQNLEAPDKMFKNGIEYIKTLIGEVPNDSYFYCEYLQKPKHNTLSYQKTPKNYLVLFDAFIHGKFVSRGDLEKWAGNFDVDVIPELYRGEATVETVKSLLETPSYLGNEILEGVVIKNYNQKILLGGTVMPLFTKYVREAFKERHTTDWKIRSPKNSLMEFIDGFKGEPRWVKAYQYLRDNSQLTNSPKDIGTLIKRVQTDVVEEEQENIKRFLYNNFKDDILRNSVKGLPEWYKNKLLENVN